MRRLALLAVLTLAAGSARADAARPDKKPDDFKRVLWELGLYGGGFFPSDAHELYEFGAATQKPLDTSLELGLRGGVLPHRNVGLELELGMSPTGAGDGVATLSMIRGHVIGQVPDLFVDRLTPFAVFGAGRFGITSDPEVLGDDADGTLHAGLGAKWKLSRMFDARLEYRHTFADGFDGAGSDDTAAGHEELLVGVTLVLGRPKPPGPDPDGDGIRGSRDACPDLAGIPPDGCPDPDPDKDGFEEEDDACPYEPGVAPDGCPILDADGDGTKLPYDKCPDQVGPPPDGCPPKDQDGDGFADDADKCPAEKGIAPDGCPDPDADKDGIPLPADKCPEQPETKNGFEDADGCPDDLPAELAKLNGAIPELRFPGKGKKLPAAATKFLDEAAAALAKHLDTRLEIAAHTDAGKDRDESVKLSQEQADAVKAYLVKKGVAEDRVAARGAGPDEPKAAADAKDKAANRRTELKTVSK